MILRSCYTMPEITFVLAIISSLFITYLFIRWILHSKGKRYPTGPFGFPIIGHLLLFGKHPPTTFMRWWKSHGNVFCIRMGSWNTVVVNGYSAVKAAAEQLDDSFSGRPQFVSVLLLNEGYGEETLSFGNFSPVYLKQKKLASKALRLLTSKRPEVIEELVSNEASIFANSLIRKYRKSSGYIKLDVQTLVVRIIYQFLFGRGKHVDIERHVKVIIKSNDEFDEFTGSGSVIDAMPWLRYIMPWRIDTFRKLMTQSEGIVKEQVHEHYESFSKDNIRDVADAIIASDADDDANQGRYVLTRSRLNLTLSDFYAAGSDTTHKTLAWLFLYMAAFPQVQELVYAEIEAVVGKDRKVELNDKASLVYTNAVIHEVMRIVTQLPFAVPHYAIKDGDIEGFHVDKGTVVLFNLYSVHHEKEFWGDPERFRPERLILEDNSLDKEKCNHILPFGIGRRRCVGEFLATINVFLSFATVMQKCRFVSPVEQRLDLSPIPGLVYAPKDFKFEVRARN